MLLALRSQWEATTWQLAAAAVSTSSGTATLGDLEAIASDGVAAATGAGALSLQEAIAAAGAGAVTGSGALALVEGFAGAGGATATGTAALALQETIAASGAGSSSGTAALAAALAFAASGGASSTGVGALGVAKALGAACISSSGGAADLRASIHWVLAAAGSAVSSGVADLVLWAFGVSQVQVAVPRSAGSIGIQTRDGRQTVYLVSPLDAVSQDQYSGLLPWVGGTVLVAPDDLPQFLHAVQGSRVLDPVAAEFWRLARPYIRLRSAP